MLKQSDSGQTGGHGRTSDIGPGLVYILGVDRHDKVPLAAVLIQVDLHHLVLGQGHLVERVCYPRILAGTGREFSVAGTREDRPVILDGPLPGLLAFYDKRRVGDVVADAGAVPEGNDHIGNVAVRTDILDERLDVVLPAADVVEALRLLGHLRQEGCGAGLPRGHVPSGP